MTSAQSRCGAVLTIDLDAICENWRRLRRQMGANAACAAVVKADAYGLGCSRVASALFRAGCETFFVATIDEATAIRPLLPGADIFVLNGVTSDTAADFVAAGVMPVLNSLTQIESWSEQARRNSKSLSAALHLDTGMSRLGLSRDGLARVCAEPKLMDGIDLRYLMSHLACSEQPEHPLNAQQQSLFSSDLKRLAEAGLSAPASFANSSALFLDPAYHYDLGRPGIALYGQNPTPGKPNPMRQVITLKGKILQVREIDRPASVGYGATHRVSGPTRIATVAVGYADGYPRSLSNRGEAYIGDHRIALVGRVSMDLVSFDVTAIDDVRPGTTVELIGPHHSLDDLAEAADTIGYEILTRMGPRYHRVYLGGD